MCRQSRHAEEAAAAAGEFSTYSISSRSPSGQFSLPLLSLQSHCPCECRTCCEPASLSCSLAPPAARCLQTRRSRAAPLCNTDAKTIKATTSTHAQQPLSFFLFFFPPSMSAFAHSKCECGRGWAGEGWGVQEDGNRCHIIWLSGAALRPR